MKDKDSKQYKSIFKNKKLTFEEKLNNACEYANQKVTENLSIHELLRLVKTIGISPLNT
jgi:hypothetical protein